MSFAVALIAKAVIWYLKVSFNFQTYSVDQLGYFSSAQAQAISMDQFNALSTDQKAVIQAQAEMTFETSSSPKSGLSLSIGS